jgi:NADPH:quinone reductase-like Zn-dependent oxidoreductase
MRGTGFDKHDKAKEIFMKAAVHTEYGSPDVLHLVEVARPVVRDSDVLIKIHTTTVTTAECMMRRGKPTWGRIILGFTKPRRKILGLELAGEIEAVGKTVTLFRKGDQVYGFTGFGLGANAEYVRMPEDASLEIKPSNITYEDAAASVDGATTALFFLKDKAHIRSGQKVLIIGASGSIGSFAVQLSSHFGAAVTGVCSTANKELVKSLGADAVIDYMQEDFTQNGETYDLIFDTVGKNSFSQCKGSLKKNGAYLSTVGLINQVLMRWTSIRGGKQVITGMSINKKESLIFLRALIEAGKLKPLIDRCYPIEQIAEAHRYVETGRKKGNVVIKVARGTC